MSGQHVWVTGSPGAGKSTVARLLADRLRLPVVELDGWAWDASWTRRCDDELRQRMEDFLASGCSWIVDGLYPSTVAALADAADTIVWLDLRLPTLLWRVVNRAVRRIRRHETLWNDNIESWAHAFGRDSVVLYLLRGYASNRRLLKVSTSNTTATVVRLRTRAQVRHWLSSN